MNGCPFSRCTQVLIIEQMLTTGGGWQDQVNGLHPGGIKRGRSAQSEADLRVEVRISLQ